jgi:hypothetical protein
MKALRGNWHEQTNYQQQKTDTGKCYDDWPTPTVNIPSRNENQDGSDDQRRFFSLGFGDFVFVMELGFHS